MFFFQQKFEKYGRVKAVTILKGFAFVQYGSPDEAEKAIEVRTKRNVVHVCRMEQAVIVKEKSNLITI